jgi:glutathione S-transferase
MMKLHGGPISPFVRKVSILLIEKDLLHLVELVRSPTAMVLANVELMKYNPLSKIPTLITEDGSALFDSDVICEYFDVNYGVARLIPPEAGPRWQALQWNALGSGGLDAAVLWRFERNRPVDQQSADTLKAYEAKLHHTLAYIENEIPVVRVTPFGIGHIALGCYLGYLDFRFRDIDWRTNHVASAAWYSQFAERPSVRATMPYEPSESIDGPTRSRSIWRSVS